MRRLRFGIVTSLVAAAAFAAPASSSAQSPVPVPEPVKEAFITAGNAVDEAEREAIDFACYVVFGFEPGTCVS